MKPNVDKVTLLAINEMLYYAGITENSLIPFGRSELSDKTGYVTTVNDLGVFIATQIGTAINRPDRYYKPGVEMPPGAVIYNDPDTGEPVGIYDAYLNGLDYSLHLRGVEWLEKGEEWQNDLVGGGWRFTDGRLIEDGQFIVVSFKPQISSVISTPDATARLFDQSGIALVTASTTMTAGNQRKLIIVQGAAAAAPTITLDSTYPEGVLCRIKSMSGLNKQTIIVAPVGQTLQRDSNTTSTPRHIIGQTESVDLVRFGTTWYVMPAGDGWLKVGHTVFGGIPGPNAISANRQPLLVADYPRVEDYLIALEAALPGSIVSVAARNGSPTKWAYDPGGTVMYTPGLGGYFPRFLDLGANIDPDRSTGAKSQLGSSQSWAVGDHKHWTLVDYFVDGDASFPPPPLATTAVVTHWYKAGSNGRESYFMVGRDDTPSIGLTSGITDPAKRSTENRPLNAGLPAIIYV